MTRVRLMLQHLADNGGWVGSPELHRITGSQRGGISSQLHDLLSRGLVVCRPDPTSRYGRNEWAITPDGVAYLHADPSTRRPRRADRLTDGYGADGGILLEKVWPL